MTTNDTWKTDPRNKGMDIKVGVMRAAASVRDSIPIESAMSLHSQLYGISRWLHHDLIGATIVGVSRKLREGRR